MMSFSHFMAILLTSSQSSIPRSLSKFRYQAALFVLALCTFVIVVVIILLILYIFSHINVSMTVFDLFVTLFHHLHSRLNVIWQSIKDQVQWTINIYGLRYDQKQHWNVLLPSR